MAVWSIVSFLPILTVSPWLLIVYCCKRNYKNVRIHKRNNQLLPYGFSSSGSVHSIPYMWLHSELRGLDPVIIRNATTGWRPWRRNTHGLSMWCGSPHNVAAMFLSQGLSECTVQCLSPSDLAGSNCNHCWQILTAETISKFSPNPTAKTRDPSSCSNNVNVSSWEWRMRWNLYWHNPISKKISLLLHMFKNFCVCSICMCIQVCILMHGLVYVCVNTRSQHQVFSSISLIIFKTRVCYLPYSWTIGVG